MRALSVAPGRAGSAALERVEPPRPDDRSLLVRGLAVGACGTDREILGGRYGWAPAGRERLVIGHESLGRVLHAPKGCGFHEGDLVVGIVRHPDPVPCPSCAAGEWDACTNGRYTEHGIKQLDGFAADRYLLDPAMAVALDPALETVGMLLEPASIVAKAWEQIERIGRRMTWLPRRVLVTGAGPIGLLAALMGAQRSLEVHVLDRVTDGPKPELVRALGATWHSGSVVEAGEGADIVVECTGAGRVVLDAMQAIGPGGITCLTGLSSGARPIEADLGLLNRSLVLENGVVFGSVNANRRHYAAAAAALLACDLAWLEGLVTSRIPLERWREILAPGPRDVKQVLDLEA